ncbi:MAG TPA: preprotein translocase subunit YajC [Gammaproteobacteria bacterium]|nr:preprotein translocase subunit YajC [Gammaproteobacteria bacterium]
MDFFIENAYAQTAPAAGGMSLSDFAFPLVLFGLMFVLLIWPQMKRQREHKQMIESLAKGDEVATSGGLIGRIIEIGPNFVLIEAAKGVEVRVQRHAIAAVLPKGSLKTL